MLDDPDMKEFAQEEIARIEGSLPARLDMPADKARADAGEYLPTGAAKLDEVLGGTGLVPPSSQPFGQDDPYFSEAVDEAWQDADPETARELLEEYVNDPNRSDGKAPGEPVSFRYDCPPDPTLNELSQLYQAFWQAIGAEVELRQVEQATHVSRPWPVTARPSASAWVSINPTPTSRAPSPRAARQLHPVHPSGSARPWRAAASTDIDSATRRGIMLTVNSTGDLLGLDRRRRRAGAREEPRRLDVPDGRRARACRATVMWATSGPRSSARCRSSCAGRWRSSSPCSWVVLTFCLTSRCRATRRCRSWGRRRPPRRTSPP